MYLFNDSDVEIWKILYEFPNYSVSNKGRIKRIKTQHILQLYRTKTSNYLYAKLRKNGKEYYRSIHRLLLMTFNPINNMSNLTVNHINGIKTDNRFPENLEWCTQSDNNKHAYKSGMIDRIGENNGRSKLRENEVWLIKKILNSDYFKNRKITQFFISRMFKVDPSLISDIKFEKLWHHIKYEKE